jgi:hypothetical protein
MPPKLDALKELCKLAGWYAPEKIEHSGGITGLFAELTGAKQQRNHQACRLASC